MVTAQKIKELREGLVLECVGQDSGDIFRLVVMHTSPSHYEALGKVTLSNASVAYQSSGPMDTDLLLQWLDTLFDRWPVAKTMPWAEHDLDNKTRLFVSEVRKAGKAI